jgi:hypothetical protein
MNNQASTLKTLVVRAINAGNTVTVGSNRIADIRLNISKESLIYYHSDEQGHIIYRNDGFPVAGGIYPNTRQYDEVYEQVKPFE